MTVWATLSSGGHRQAYRQSSPGQGPAARSGACARWLQGGPGAVEPGPSAGVRSGVCPASSYPGLQGPQILVLH